MSSDGEEGVPDGQVHERAGRALPSRIYRFCSLGRISYLCHGATGCDTRNLRRHQRACAVLGLRGHGLHRLDRLSRVKKLGEEKAQAAMMASARMRAVGQFD